MMGEARQRTLQYACALDQVSAMPLVPPPPRKPTPRYCVMPLPRLEDASAALAISGAKTLTWAAAQRGMVRQVTPRRFAA